MGKIKIIEKIKAFLSCQQSDSFDWQHITKESTAEVAPEQHVVFPSAEEPATIAQPADEEKKDEIIAKVLPNFPTPEFVDIPNIPTETRSDTKDSEPPEPYNLDKNGTDDALHDVVHKIVDLIGFYDGYSAMAPDEAKDLYEDVSDKLIELLIDAGATPIDDHDAVYDPNYHRTNTGTIVAPGTSITNIVRQGAQWNGEVLLCAKVEVKQDNTDTP